MISGRNRIQEIVFRIFVHDVALRSSAQCMCCVAPIKVRPLTASIFLDAKAQVPHVGLIRFTPAPLPRLLFLSSLP
jgi:hypothetical protein